MFWKYKELNPVAFGYIELNVELRRDWVNKTKQKSDKIQTFKIKMLKLTFNTRRRMKL